MMPRLCTCRDRASSRGGLASICRFSVTHNLVRFCIRWLNIPTQRTWVRHSGDWALCSRIWLMNGSLMNAGSSGDC